MTRTPDQAFVFLVIPKTGDDVNVPAEGSYMVGCSENAAGKYLSVLVTRGDDVLLGRLAHRKDILILIDYGVADQNDAIVPYLFDKAENYSERVIIAQSGEVTTDVRLKEIEMPVDQFGRTESDFVGESDRPAMGFHGMPLQ